MGMLEAHLAEQGSPSAGRVASSKSGDLAHIVEGGLLGSQETVLDNHVEMLRAIDKESPLSSKQTRPNRLAAL